MNLDSGICAGVVTHTRLRPRHHALRYDGFSLLLDLDELPRQQGALRWLSLNRFNLLAVHERDHGDGRAQGLLNWVRQTLRAAGQPASGRVLLLTMPRVLGYGFNPLSVYFCHDEQGVLRSILYEVNNTFGERHHYLLPVDARRPQGAWVKQQCPKRMHVSPFLPMDMHYRFGVLPPGARPGQLALIVQVHDAQGLVLSAHQRLQWRPLDDAGLLRAFLAFPLVTLKVMAAIHWEALQLWLKRVGFFRKPAPPRTALTTSLSTSLGSSLGSSLSTPPTIPRHQGPGT